MNNRVLKLRPDDYWNIVEHESWFTEMARKGLLLKKVGVLFTHFERGSKQEMKYRIEVSKKPLSEEQLDYYEASGWQYVTSYHYFHVFSSPANLGAPEIHTDPAEQAYTLQELNRQLKFNVIVTFFATLLNIGFSWAIFFLDGTPIFQLVQGSSTQLLIVLSMLILAIHSLRAAISTRRLINNLQFGKPLQHDRPMKKSRFLRHMYGMIALIIGMLCCISAFFQIFFMESMTITKEDEASIISLASIEQNDALIGDEFSMDDLDYTNYFRKEWSLFAPTQYETRQEGLVPGAVWHDGSGPYTPSVTTRYYEVRPAFLAVPLAKDLVKWYSFDEDDVFHEDKHPQFDALYINEELAFIQIIVAFEGKVMYLNYGGYATREEIIIQLEKYLIR